MKQNSRILQQHNSDTDQYGDGDVPEVDYEPYRNNHFDPHPQAGGENCITKNRTRNDPGKNNKQNDSGRNN